jgi:Uncharacterized protein conserved in bacteria
MTFHFEAPIYSIGINWCVDVPTEICSSLESQHGRIFVKGQINGFHFEKYLVPVRGAAHRLFVNGEMMKGGQTRLGATALFVIEQSLPPEKRSYPLPLLLQRQLEDLHLMEAFDTITPSRKNAILKYFSFIKTEETLQRNICKLTTQLKNGVKNVHIP